MRLELGLQLEELCTFKMMTPGILILFMRDGAEKKRNRSVQRVHFRMPLLNDLMRQL